MEYCCIDKVLYKSVHIHNNILQRERRIPVKACRNDTERSCHCIIIMSVLWDRF